MEIELKVTIEYVQPLLSLLEKEGSFSYEDHQIDYYYVPAHRNFLAEKPIKEWLRLRDSNGTFYITYKKRYYNADGTSNHADEHEVEIKNLETGKKIFEVLNFVPIITVDKIRKAWRYKEYEICVDKVADLGDFVEIEYKGTRMVEPNAETDEMMKFLEGLNCGKIVRPRKGYPWMLLEKRGLV
jgi:adenylate cyclase, class 2